MIKLYKAPSLLYRRQIFQENIRWKAPDEIYKICMLLHRSDLNISENFVKLFCIFQHFFLQKFHFFHDFRSSVPSIADGRGSSTDFGFFSVLRPLSANIRNEPRGLWLARLLF